MRQGLALLAASLFASAAYSQEVYFPDGTPASQLGGIMLIRQGNQTTLSLGGILFPRKLKVKTHTPEGPIVTRFVLPSVFHTPEPIPFLDLNAAPATMQIEIPDIYGLIYIEGELVASHGTSRQFESPPLRPGLEYPLKIRGVFAVGENLLIQDKLIVMRAGESIQVNFDGQQALAVPLPRDASVELATPRSDSYPTAGPATPSSRSLPK